MGEYNIFDLGYLKDLTRGGEANLESLGEGVYQPPADVMPDLGTIGAGDYMGGITQVPTETVTPSGDITSGPLTATMNQSDGALYNGKTSFTDTTAGYRLGLDATDNVFKFIIGSSTSSMDWSVTTLGVLTVNGTIIATAGTLGAWTIGATTITGGTLVLNSAGAISQGKTSFTDSTNAGYYLGSEGIYVGAASDVSKLKYTVATGVFDFIGTVSSRSTVTIAATIDVNGNVITDLINARINTSAATILTDFDFGAADYAGAVNAGNIVWSSVTGAVISGSGVVLYRKGIVGAAAGVVTFAIDATTGAATFVGAVTANSGYIGGASGWTIASGSISSVNGANTTTMASGGTNAYIAGTTGSPQFIVTHAGALTATSATITGAITATSGSIGSFTIGTYLYSGSKTAYNDANAGVHLGSDGIGFGNNVFTVSAAGALTATSATITGAITATSGSIGSFTIGTYLYTGTKTAYNDTNAGVHIGSDGIGFGNNVFTVSAAGDVVASSITLTGGVIKFGKTSFADSTNAGYYIGSDGIYVGAASDVSKLKYTVSSGVFDFIGTVSSRSTVTIAATINAAGNVITDLINARLNTSAATILTDFDFGAVNYAGAVVAGDIAWNVTTGAVTGGSGVALYRKGIVGAAAGVVTFSIDAVTGNATFLGTVTATGGSFSGFTIGADYINDTANSFGLSSTVTAGDDVRFWAGDTFANRAIAPARIYESGAFHFGSATQYISFSGTGVNVVGSVVQIDTSTGAIKGNIQNVVALTAGETINGATLPVAAFLQDSDNQVYACDGNDLTKLDFIGFATTNGTDGNAITVQTDGVVTGFTGLTYGAKYYVQDDKTIGVTPGTYELLVGQAMSTTTLLIIKRPINLRGGINYSWTSLKTISGTAAGSEPKVVTGCYGASNRILIGAIENDVGGGIYSGFSILKMDEENGAIYTLTKTDGSTNNLTSSSAGGIAFNGTNFFVSEVIAGSRITYNGTSQTFSGTGRRGSLAWDLTNSKLLVLYSTTLVAKFSHAVNTLTNLNTDVTLDTAITIDLGYIYDDTNAEYIFLDTTGNLLRKFNATGTTISTVAISANLASVAKGLAVIDNTIYVVVGNSQVTGSDANDSAVTSVSFVRTRMSLT